MSRNWVGMSRIWKDFMQKNFGLTFRSLEFDQDREGLNREKLTVKKIINNEIFFSPFMSLINREKSA